MTQLNSPYPATPYLTAWLRKRGYAVEQRDFGLELALALFSRAGFERAKEAATAKKWKKFFADYADTIEPTVRFLQGRDPALALRISTRAFLPEGPRFAPLLEHGEILDSFGDLGLQDRAKYLASLYLDDAADAIREGLDPRFEFSRYGEKLAASQPSFSPLRENLERAPTLVDTMLAEITERALAETQPDVIGLSVPFPGNVYGALRIAKVTRETRPRAKIVMGGGYVNTELRALTDPRIFDYVDYLTYDDGELPFQLLLEHFAGKRGADTLTRAKARVAGEVKTFSAATPELPFKEVPGPAYDGLPLAGYVSMMELPNPMHRMWSDFRWNKLILAHGCYWRRCSFCDITLDYIRRYDPAGAERIVHDMELLIAETGQSGFHFVDEAAPPALLKAMSERILARGLKVSWWGNLRFDKQFTPKTAELMAEAGCVAVTGGLEVASPRILKLIEKGIDIAQVARVTRAFTDAGIYVHAYLMYGFPTQTLAETIDSLEVVRQLFANDCIQSGYWHRFTATVHSPVGQNPGRYGIILHPHATPPEGKFAENDIPFEDPTGCDHEALGFGLRKALYNYMHGVGIAEDVREWFDFAVPKPKVPKTLIAKAIKD